jgi:hypothetical protein
MADISPVLFVVATGGIKAGSTSTLHKFIPRHGFNETGILPDVPIGDEVENKVDFIVRFYQE